MNKYMSVAILIILSTIALIHLNEMTNWSVDDAYISYRYTSNWADGLGPVFNAGEKVEGYSNFLHVVALSLLGKIGFDIENASRAIGWLSVIGLLALMTRFFYLRFSRHCALFIFGAGLVLSTATPLMIWANGGLETLPFTLILFAAVTEYFLFLQDKSPRWLHSLLFGLLAISRPEGFAYFVPVLVFELGQILRHSKNKSEIFTKLAKQIIPFLAVLLPCLVFRRVYYGHWLPNTVVAKDSYQVYLSGLPFAKQVSDLIASGGVQKISGFLSNVWGYWLLSIALLPFLNKEMRYRQLVLLAIVSVNFTVSIWNLGGWMNHYRLLVPTIPIIILMMTFGLEQVLLWMQKNFVPLLEANDAKKTSLQKRIQANAICALLIFGFFACCADSIFYQRSDFTWKKKYHKEWIEFGEKLNTLATPNDLMASWFIGRIPYKAIKLNTLDILGLTDDVIAREGKKPNDKESMKFGKTKWDYVVSRKPNLFMTKTKGELRQVIRHVPGFMENMVEVRRRGPRRDNLWLFIDKDHPKLAEYLKTFNAVSGPVVAPPSRNARKKQEIERKREREREQEPKRLRSREMKLADPSRQSRRRLTKGR